jgi:hypothetical protein
MPLAQDAPYSDITYKIIGAALAVHHKIGPGYKEQVYQDMLTDQMLTLGLAVVPEKKVEIVVECKAVPHLLTNEEVAQVITYLAATNLPVGLLLNFGRKSMQPKRIFRPKKLDDWQQRIAPYLWRPPV